MKKKSEVSIFIPDKADLRAQVITGDKKSLFIMIEVNSLRRHNNPKFFFDSKTEL